MVCNWFQWRLGIGEWFQWLRLFTKLEYNYVASSKRPH